MSRKERGKGGSQANSNGRRRQLAAAQGGGVIVQVADPAASSEIVRFHVESQQAMLSGDFVTATEKNLECAKLMSPVWLDMRWTLFQIACTRLHSQLCQATLQRTSVDGLIRVLKEKFLESEEEPLLFRAYSAFILAMIYWQAYDSHGNPSVGVAAGYIQRAKTFRNAATRQERGKKVSSVDLDPSEAQSFRRVRRTVGEELGKLDEHIEILYTSLRWDELRLRGVDSFAMMAGQGSEGFNDRRRLGEYLQEVIALNDHGCVAAPPLVTSALIQKVRSLPEQEIAWLVVGYQVVPRTNPILDGQLIFSVFSVNMDRCNRGKRTEVFQQIKVVVTEKNEKSMAKFLIGAFAAACLEPSTGTGTLKPATKSKQPPFRPSRAYIDTKQEACLSQVRSFLTMMGCLVVDTVEPRVVALLDASIDQVMAASAKQLFPKEQFPHTHDLCAGKGCGNCQLTGTKLKCSCRQAYYCNKECQLAHWGAHKATHRMYMSSQPNQVD